MLSMLDVELGRGVPRIWRSRRLVDICARRKICWLN